MYERLADAVSRETFASVLNYKLSGRLSYLQACTTNRADDLRALFSFGGEETYLDLGAYNGDTVQEFLQLTRGRYKNHCIGAGPEKLQETDGLCPTERTETYNLSAGRRVE